MEIIIESNQVSWKSITSYMCINFEDTKDAIIKLYSDFINQWKICELYPTPTKLGKQFEYADKKWITHCIILGSGELEQWIYKIKNLATGEEEIVKL